MILNKSVVHFLKSTFNVSSGRVSNLNPVNFYFFRILQCRKSKFVYAFNKKSARSNYARGEHGERKISGGHKQRKKKEN